MRGHVLIVLVSCVALAGCGGASRTWPSTTHVQSAAIDADYCSADYQRRFGWPDPEKAARVCRCESHGDPRAVSKNGLYAGLFQFSRASWAALGPGDPFDPATNSEHAHRLWRRQGWRPWPTCGRR